MPFKAEEYKIYDHFQVSEVAPTVIHLAINRPKVRNCFSQKTWKQYRDILLSLDKDAQNVKVIILTGNGKLFCSGIDLKDTGSTLGALFKDSNKEKVLYQHLREFQQAVGTPARIGIPIIAVTHDVTFGLALDILSSTSIRYTAKDAKFSIPEIKLGFAADIGALQRLPRIVGNQSLLYELVLTGEPFNAQTAQSLGLVSGVYESKEKAFEHALKVAKIISRYSKDAIVGVKDSTTFIVEGGSAEEGLDRLAKYNARHLPHFGKL